MTGVTSKDTARERPRRPCLPPAESLCASGVHQAMDGSLARQMTHMSGSEQPAGVLLTQKVVYASVCGAQVLSMRPRGCKGGSTLGKSPLESSHTSAGPPRGIHDGGSTRSRAPALCSPSTLQQGGDQEAKGQGVGDHCAQPCTGLRPSFQVPYQEGSCAEGMSLVMSLFMTYSNQGQGHQEAKEVGCC
jgi:hypothetical protein